MPAQTKTANSNAMQNPLAYWNSFFQQGDISKISFEKNIAALNTANKIYMEYLTLINRRAQQIMQESINDCFGLMKNSLAVTSTPDARLSDNVEFAKQSFEKSIANSGELAEMCAKSSREALDIFTKRASEIMDEAKKQIEQIQKAA